MRKRAVGIVGAGLVAVLLSGVFFPAATAASWETFGFAWARGRSQGAPFVSIESTTKTNPTAVKIRVYTGDANPKVTNVLWWLTCWSSDLVELNSFTGSGNQELPFVLEWDADELPVPNPDYCEADVRAFHLNKGRINLKVQAQYGG